MRTIGNLRELRKIKLNSHTLIGQTDPPCTEFVRAIGQNQHIQFVELDNILFTPLVLDIAAQVELLEIGPNKVSEDFAAPGVPCAVQHLTMVCFDEEVFERVLSSVSPAKLTLDCDGDVEFPEVEAASLEQLLQRKSSSLIGPTVYGNYG